MPPDQRHPQIQRAGQIHCAVHEKPFPCSDCVAAHSPDQSLPEGVELLRDVKLCADCGQPVTNGGGHIHGRFSPVRFVSAVRYSDLPKIIEQARQEEREKALPLLDELRDSAIAYAEGATGAGERLSRAESRLADALNPDTPEGGSQ